VQNDSNGTGCINSDPCFVTPGYWDPNGTPADANDDFWVDGDYRLKSNSPCIDTGKFAYCMYLPSYDLDGNTRLAGTKIDMGCFETSGSLDSDGDWLADSSEPTYANNPDRDSDGILDGIELIRGTDPNVFNAIGQLSVPNDVNVIQLALFCSRSGETIIVNQGTYYENLYIGGRNITLTSTGPNDPNIVAATIINADTDSDPCTPNGRVVTFASTYTEINTSDINGLTITSGRDYKGGGIYGYGNLLTASISHCIVSNNHALDSGGGLYFYGSITGCAISGNYANGSGGGLGYCDGPIADCNITANSANDGGGMYRCDGQITNCTISSNVAVYNAGALFNCDGTITDCIIFGNSAMYTAGLINCDGPIINCIITNNSSSNPASYSGGLYDCDGNITNSTIAHNSSAGSVGGLNGCDGTISNCIIWANSGSQIVSSSTPTYSCVQSWSSGGLGNINSDPCFADTVSADPNLWDYHLKSSAGRWNSNSKSWVYDSVTSPCIDAGNPGYSLGDEPSGPNNVRINMGTYGGTAEASKIPAGWSLLPDLNNDGIVDSYDYLYQADDWLKAVSNHHADLDRNSTVNWDDIALLVRDWLETTTWH
ncbi:MAG: choice-of-anchor Q domain-containing protein, partial [Planctomycetota bacterium]